MEEAPKTAQTWIRQQCTHDSSPLYLVVGICQVYLDGYPVWVELERCSDAKYEEANTAWDTYCHLLGPKMAG